jgi:AcrR family transcriptional regulator
MKSKRLDPEDRRAEILAAAVKLAERDGYQNITRRDIAGKARVSESLVSHYFNPMFRMYRAVMVEAVKTENLQVIAQGLVAGDVAARKVPTALKFRALNSLG